jgi:hypothetical protein
VIIMASLPTNEQCERIHAQFCALTGIPAEFTMSARFIWESFLARGYGEPDIACVTRYIKERIKQKRREKESLMMRNMVQNLDYFAETLSMARAESRNSRTESPKAEIIRAAGYQDKPRDTARPIGDIVAAAKALEDLRRWRTENGL